MRAAGVLMALFVLLCCGCRRPAETHEVELRLPDPKPPVVDVILLLDQSGSMSGAKGTDPSGVRIDAAEYLVANVSEKSSEDEPNRVGVVEFGDQARAPDTYMHKVTPTHGTTEACASLTVRNMGGTNVIAALKLALEWLQRSGTFDRGNKGRLVLFTDGKPEDDRALTADAYFAELNAFVDKAILPKGCELYVVAIDQSGQTWSDWGPRWTRLLGEKHVVRLANVQELRQRFNHIVNQIFSIPQVPPDLLTEGRKSFTVKPYLDRVEFHVFLGTREMKLRILRPDGSPVKPDSDQDVRRRQFRDYEIISVFDPRAGEWEYEVTAGKGRVEVYRNEVPLTMKLVLPGTVHPQGKALKIIAQFARRSGKPVTSETEFPLGLSAQVLGPTGKPVNVEFGDPIDGLYYGNRPISTKMPGLYAVTLRVQAGNALDSQTVYQVHVAPVPYLALDAPKVVGLPFLQRHLSISGRLMRTGKATSPAEHFTNSPNLLYLAQVATMPDGGKSPTVWLASSGTRLGAQFALPMRQSLGIAQPLPGNYLVATECAGKPIQPSATVYVDRDMSLVTVRESWLYLAATILVGLLGLYLLVVATSWAWLATRLLTARKMLIGVSIVHAPTGTQLGAPRLPGRTWVSTRTKAWRDPSPSKGRRARAVGGRLFFFWGIDKAAATVGFARIVLGVAVPGSLRQGSSRSVGALRIQL